MKWIAPAVLLIASLVCLGASGPDLSSMNFMLGTWTCAGRAMDGTTFRLTETTKLSSDGTRLVTRDSTGKVETDLWYEPTRKLWMQTSVNSNDGSNSSQTSPGWKGDTLVFTGQLNVRGIQTLQYRSTTTKVNASKTQQVDEISVAAADQPNWTQFDTAACTKGP